MSQSASVQFERIYASLPPDVQKVVLEKELIALLDVIPKSKAQKIISESTRLQSRYSGLPKLDLRAKKVEMDSLLDALNRDTKRTLVTDHSNPEEVLSESIKSSVEWLSDIWSVAYEYGTNFSLVHTCLVYTAEVLERIGAVGGGCSFMSVPVFVEIKKSSPRQTIKTFSFLGAHNLDEVLLWIWRDLFLSILANGESKDRNSITPMLQDIEEQMGWAAVMRVLSGGKHYDFCGPFFGDYFDDDTDNMDDEITSESNSDPFSDSMCLYSYEARHWSSLIRRQRLHLRELVKNQLLATFAVIPSLHLFQALMELADESEEMRLELLSTLSSIAATCADTLAAALEIYSFENELEQVSALLDSHSHLLRPCDHESLRIAAQMLSSSSQFRALAHQILEKELVDTVHMIHSTVLFCFSGMDETSNKDEIGHIIKLAAGSSARSERITRWVDAVISPNIAPVHPMAVAAAMIGIPLPPGINDPDDADPFGYLDADPTDEDLEDLREELRPNMKMRWEGWCDTAFSMKGGANMLFKIYNEVVGLMPMFRAPDAVSEMISRLMDKPSKHHICDAMDALSTFATSQRKKTALKADRQKKRKKPTGPSSTANTRSPVSALAVTPNPVPTETNSTTNQP